MGPGIDSAVSVVIIGHIFPASRGIPGIEGKLQDLHVGIAGIPDQLSDRICHIAQVLGNDLKIREGLLQGSEDVHAGALLPEAVLCRGLSRGDGKVLVKAPEMVQTDHIIELSALGDPADPPGIPFFFVVVPVIEGVAPELAVRGESVRRNAGYLADLSP